MLKSGVNIRLNKIETSINNLKNNVKKIIESYQSLKKISIVIKNNTIF